VGQFHHPRGQLKTLSAILGRGQDHVLVEEDKIEENGDVAQHKLGTGSTTRLTSPQRWQSLRKAAPETEFLP
jgi:hypothetical protein